jgi:hypothetical protein
MTQQPSSSHAEKTRAGDGEAPSKRQLQRQMGRTRERVTETVEQLKATAGDVKEKAEQQLTSAKEAVTSVLDYREEFQREPVIWGLGALSAGFALGYTLGYAHKISKTDRHSPMAGFVDGLVDELSKIGQRVVMPNVNVKIRELFGFDFPALLEQMRAATRSGENESRQRASRTSSVKKSVRKKKSR